MIIWIARNGERYGPYSFRAVLGYLEQGDLSLSDQAWALGQEGWEPLGEVLPGASETTGSEESDAEFYETIEKLKNLVLKEKADHAFDLLVGLNDARIYDELLVGCAIGNDIDDGDILDMPEWVEWDNSQKLFIYRVMGSAPDASAAAAMRKDVKHLEFSDSELTHWPAEIYGFENVTSIDASGNSLKALSKEIGSLGKLEILRLEGNKFKKAPPELTELKNLKELNLNSNKLNSDPSSLATIGELHGLRTLSLDDNALGELPLDFSRLKHLSSLSLERNKFKKKKLAALFEALAAAPALEKLNLAQNGCKEMPPEILKLSSLKELNVSSNKLDEVPSGLAELPQLVSLNLWGNPVQPGRTEDSCPALPTIEGEEVDWSESSYSSWNRPDSISLSEKSETLLDEFVASFDHHDSEVVDEAIEAILESGDQDLLVEVVRGCYLDPDGYFMTGPHFPFPDWIDFVKTNDDVETDPEENWRGFSWSYDDKRSGAALPHYALLRLMGHLPEDERVHPSLKKENVRLLYLVLPKRIPPEIGAFTELEELNASRCGVTELPPEISRLVKLQILSMEGNDLKTLPSCIGGMTELQYLGLHGNSINELPPEVGNLDELRVLDLGGNSLTELLPEIGRLAKLQFLGLQGNQLKVLPPEIGQLGSLLHLWLGGNQLQALPEELYQLDSLVAMGLVGNFCYPTDNKWLRGVQLTIEMTIRDVMAIKASDPEDAKWILNNVLTWNS